MLVTDFHLRYSCRDHIYFLGSSFTQVNDTPFYEGASVVDSDPNGSAIAKIGHFHFCSKWQGFVCCGQFPLAEDFSVTGFSAFIFVGIIGGITRFCTGPASPSRFSVTGAQQLGNCNEYKKK